MRFQESVCKASQGLTLILAGLIICGLLMVASICLAAGDKWTKKADMFTARDSLATCVVDGKIYAIGGWPPDAGIKTVEEYDPVTDKWTKKADMPTARYCLSTSAVYGKIYAIGGGDGVGPSFSTVGEYDPVTDKWTKKADMPTARDGLSASVVNDEIYVIGGKSALALVWNPLSAVEVYNPAKDNWTKKADMPTARCYLATGAVDGKVYAIGGCRAFGTAFSTVEEYDTAIDKWTKKADMLTARGWFSAIEVNGKIYAVGGASAGNVTLATMEEYTPEGWPFAVSSQDRLVATWGKIKRGR